jgi:hypothetical protein
MTLPERFDFLVRNKLATPSLIETLANGRACVVIELRNSTSSCFCHRQQNRSDHVLLFGRKLASLRDCSFEQLGHGILLSYSTACGTRRARCQGEISLFRLLIYPSLERLQLGLRTGRQRITVEVQQHRDEMVIADGADEIDDATLAEFLDRGLEGGVARGRICSGPQPRTIRINTTSRRTK